MTCERILRALGCVAVSILMVGGSVASAASAQTPGIEPGHWRIGAWTGGYMAPSPLIEAADSFDTRLNAGPAFSLEAQYQMSDPVSVYGSGMLALATVQLGSSIRPAVVGPSEQVTVATTTAGLMLAATDWLVRLQPTLRVGGGIKWYRFDLTDAENQVRPTAEVGVGLRGIGLGAIEATTEIRYLISSFDQAKLPTRGISTQEQRQNDLVFSVGVAFRP